MLGCRFGSWGFLQDFVQVQADRQTGALGVWCRTWGPAVCMGKYGKMAKSRRNKIRKSYFCIVFSRIVWPKSLPGPPGSPADHPDKVWTSPDHSRPISHPFYFFDLNKKNTCFLFSSIFKVFRIFWCFFELLRLRGQVPDCRSRRELSIGIIKSSGNLQGSSFLTKHCPKSTNLFQEVFLWFSFILSSGGCGTSLRL